METVTPKEKALRLMGKFENALTIKDCAKVTIDEMLDAIKFMPYGVQYLSARDYFEEVKEEINKL
jgi:hypothetical protein